MLILGIFSRKHEFTYPHIASRPRCSTITYSHIHRRMWKRRRKKELTSIVSSVQFSSGQRANEPYLAQLGFDSFVCTCVCVFFLFLLNFFPLYTYILHIVSLSRSLNGRKIPKILFYFSKRFECTIRCTAPYTHI